MNSEMQSKISTLGVSLGLSRPPIGLAFVEQPPDDIGRPDVDVPAACSFWRMAKQEVFYAAEDEHFNCPLGVMTMGFQIPADRQEEARTIVDTMCELEYITPEEANIIPSVSGDHKGIVYGPLAQMPVEPDVAIFVCKPSQAMLLAEASGGVTWTGEGITAFGRPACAIVPIALSSMNTSMSVGCVGFRVYTGISDEELLIAVPRNQIQKIVDKLGTTVSANGVLEEFHTQRRSDL